MKSWHHTVPAISISFMVRVKNNTHLFLWEPWTQNLDIFYWKSNALTWVAANLILSNLFYLSAFTYRKRMTSNWMAEWDWGRQAWLEAGFSAREVLVKLVVREDVHGWVLTSRRLWGLSWVMEWCRGIHIFLGFREVWDGQYLNLLLGSREKAQEVKLLSQKMQNWSADGARLCDLHHLSGSRFSWEAS